MFLDRRLFIYFDWISFILIIVLSCISLLCIYSATYKPELPLSIYFYKQLVGIISGLILYVCFCCMDYRTLQRWGYFGFFIVIFLLLFTLIKGSLGKGAHRWINLGIIKFQPSELTKLLFPSFFTYYLFTEEKLSTSWQTFAPMISMVLVSAILIIKQPDLGTGLLILFSAAALMWLAGINKHIVTIIALLTCISAPLTWTILKPYQKRRITVFFGEGDQKKERYHIEQSKIAIGSGGLWGKGFLQGTQNRLHFLPERHTDSIFSVLCEEWGFSGALVLIILYIVLYVHCFMITRTISNFYAQLLAMGLVLPSLISTIINMGMVIGLLPIVGIPLPFMSYGISHLWITFASFGLFNSIAMRRFYMNKGL